MLVTVRLFGPEARAAGADHLSVNLPENPTCADLLEILRATHPFLGHARIARNHDFANPADPINPSDELAIIGLVSGG